MTLIVGLYMLTIGTFLGGVWANESWGRYWGWDPKETWALTTAIVYAVILHLRLVPGLKGRVLFNILALAGFSSVIMTYFGVNYYLSGLHSYAKGDPMPVPPVVYYAVVSVFLLSFLAAWNQGRLEKKSGGGSRDWRLEIRELHAWDNLLGRLCRGVHLHGTPHPPSLVYWRLR